MKVMSFNIRSQSDANGHSIHERAPRLKSVVERYDPDVIGFQEVVPLWMEHIPQDYQHNYEIFQMYRDDTVDIEGLAILWKKGQFECLDRGWFWYSDTPDEHSRGWCKYCYRICLWVKLRRLEDGKEFHLFNSHFGFGEDCQRNSAELLLSRVEAACAERAILVGDFNMTRKEKMLLDLPNVAYPIITEKFIDVNQVTARDERTTFHNYRADAVGAPIDYCFISKQSVSPLSYHCIDDTFDGKYPSDHYGLLLELELN